MAGSVSRTYEPDDKEGPPSDQGVRLECNSKKRDPNYALEYRIGMEFYNFVVGFIGSGRRE